MPNRFIRISIALAAVLSLQNSIAQTVSGAGGSARNFVVYNERLGTVNINVINMRIEDLVNLITNQVPIEIRLPIRTEEIVPLSVAFRDVELTSALLTIFDGFNKVVSYEPPLSSSTPDMPSQITRIELLSPSSFYQDVITEESLVEVNIPDDSTQVIEISQETSDLRAEIEKQIREALENYNASTRDFLLGMYASYDDLYIRGVILSSLAAIGDETLFEFMVDVTAEESEATLRSYAIQGIIALRSEGWLEIVSDIMLNDYDSGVRRTAVLTSPIDVPEIEAVIQSLAADENDLVRHAALMRLGRADEIELEQQLR